MLCLPVSFVMRLIRGYFDPHHLFRGYFAGKFSFTGYFRGYLSLTVSVISWEGGGVSPFPFFFLVFCLFSLSRFCSPFGHTTQNYHSSVWKSFRYFHFLAFLSHIFSWHFISYSILIILISYCLITLQSIFLLRSKHIHRE